jgi:GT2 family glycosyltransferase
LEPKVVIIILNWNGLSDTVRCLESIQDLDYTNYEVIVVDNGSNDNSVAYLNENFPWIVLIENEKNLGFTGGNNIAMRYAVANNGDYVWLVNNDTVLHANSLRNLVSLAESSPSIGLATPVIFYLDNPDKFQFAGSYFDWKSFSLTYPNDEDEVGREFKNGKDVCLWGTALLIKRNVIETIGVFREEYFAYWEDTEYSLRALKHGFRNVVCRDAKIYHKAGMIQREYWARGKYFFYYMSRNQMLMAMEYIKGRTARLNLKIRFLAELADRLRFVPPEYLDTWDVRLLGLWHGLKGLSGAMQDKPRVPDIYRKTLRILSRCHPLFLLALVRFDFAEMYRRLVNK